MQIMGHGPKNGLHPNMGWNCGWSYVHIWVPIHADPGLSVKKLATDQTGISKTGLPDSEVNLSTEHENITQTIRLLWYKVQR